MNNIGMIIDISHVSDEAFMQVLDISKAPVIASHSSLSHFTLVGKEMSLMKC